MIVVTHAYTTQTIILLCSCIINFNYGFTLILSLRCVSRMSIEREDYVLNKYSPSTSDGYMQLYRKSEC